MSIHVECPNGHKLKVHVRHAGQTGLCPKCQQRVLVPELKVPEPAPVGLGENEIAAMLGDPAEEEPLDVHQELRHRQPGRTSDSTLAGGSSIIEKTKRCPRCKGVISARLNVCPLCQTYCPGGSASTKPQSLICRQCGTESIPGDAFCTGCGAELH
ncbi:MAG: zinc ribbon domain-containing protein [Planctomycetales bacterium]|nr:zinc ribbon domain-containing protein [Planctomycetales bacterium]